MGEGISTNGASSGYYCAVCGQFVSYGIIHACSPPSFSPTNCCACCAYMAQINQLIQRLEALLAKLEAA